MELKLVKIQEAIPLGLLLIVPYGIETLYCLQQYVSPPLLIVPYGIETLPTQFLQGSKGPFNRTLWN